jgi:hypothetical protein
MKTTQEREVLRYLAQGKPLTPLQALHKFGSFRLGARIHALRNQGWPIETDWATTPNGARVASYRMRIK